MNGRGADMEEMIASNRYFSEQEAQTENISVLLQMVHKVSVRTFYLPKNVRTCDRSSMPLVLYRKKDT